ncbi:MAG: DsbA family protein [Rhizobiaceae bacterium]|nr:DsbA family protein [Rhizobiaceae bacterium]
MNRAILLGTGGIAVAFGMLAFGYLAGSQQVAIAEDARGGVMEMTDAQGLTRSDVEKIVREYLVANPDILVEMQDALEKKQKEEQKIAQLETINGAREEIFNSPYDAVVGNPEGKVTIVEFYDYNCGFCKRAFEDMLKLTADDTNLRFVLKEFPILGPDSQKAHVVSQALHRLMPEKYQEFHYQMMTNPGRASEATAMKVALSLGADEAKLREAMKDPAIGDVFDKAYDLANKLNVTGTPSYVVGNEVVFGAQGYELLAEKIKLAEACLANATC